MSLAVDTQNLHPSTEACLEALQWLEEHENFDSILEIGCGNGILSLVAAHIWGARVLAADIAPKAVADAAKAVAEHGMEEQITVLRSDGFSNPQIKAGGPYGLIIANLLPQLQIRLAQDIKNCLLPSGYLLLAGIQSWLAPETEKAFTDLGFEKLKEFSISPWNAYIFRAVIKA